MKIEELKNKIINADCLEIMKELPDKCIYLILTDPPYGINANNMQLGSSGNKIPRAKENWDSEIPKDEVFEQILRISKNQIIFGGNYFPEEWLCDMTTTGLSITWKEGNIMGMVITAQKAIEGLVAPLNINTPFIQVASYHLANDTCNDVYFDNQCEQLLEKVLADAKRYMNGEVMNKQQKLELG